MFSLTYVFVDKFKDFRISDLPGNQVEDSGGDKPAEGWRFNDWEEPRDFFREAFTEVPDNFASVRELLDFVYGAGSHWDNNSYFIDNEDIEMMEDEGFFQPYNCHRCVEELGEKSLDEKVDPSLSFNLQGPYQKESYRPGFDKYGVSAWFSCSDHTNVFLTEEITWYEEK